MIQVGRAPVPFDERNLRVALEEAAWKLIIAKAAVSSEYE